MDYYNPNNACETGLLESAKYPARQRQNSGLMNDAFQTTQTTPTKCDDIRSALNVAICSTRR